MGDQIKAIRLERGLTQKKLALLLDVSPETILGWEKNDHKPTISYLPRIYELLGIQEEKRGDDSVDISLGEQLKATRQHRGLNQKNAARQIAIDPSTLSKYERNLAVPPTQILDLVTAFLDGDNE